MYIRVKCKFTISALIYNIMVRDKREGLWWKSKENITYSQKMDCWIVERTRDKTIMKTIDIKVTLNGRKGICIVLTFFIFFAGSASYFNILNLVSR